MPTFIPIQFFFLTSNVTGGISDFLWPPSYPAVSNTVFLAWENEAKSRKSINSCKAILKQIHFKYRQHDL